MSGILRLSGILSGAKFWRVQFGGADQAVDHGRARAYGIGSSKQIFSRFTGDNRFVRKRVLLQVLSGTADANIRFEELRSLLDALGFAERIKAIITYLSAPAWRRS